MGRPKKQKQDKYVPTPEDTKAMLWCIDNKIRVYPIPTDNEYALEVEFVDNGRIKKKRSSVTYPKDNWSSKLYELYRHMYEKNC
jgi:hypothetical protein